MNNELFEALTILEKEKNISKDTLLDAIKQSLLQACKNHYGKTEANNVWHTTPVARYLQDNVQKHLKRLHQATKLFKVNLKYNLQEHLKPSLQTDPRCPKLPQATRTSACIC